MKLLLHDFAGHAFPVQLARELAARGHHVAYAYAGGLPGPKGHLRLDAVELNQPAICEVPLSSHFRKYSAIRRVVTQRTYARDLQALIARERPDVVLSTNTPIDVQGRLLTYCRAEGIAFVHWVQDVYFRALEFVLRHRVGPLGRFPALPFRRLEKAVVLTADAVIAITPDFQPLFLGWGLPESRLSVIENWAPLDEVTTLPRRNSWSESLGLGDQPVFLYAGTLGLKHRPALIYQLARALHGQAKVVVLSEGIGRQYLERQPPLNNLMLLDFQPYERLSEVLASADVLLATLAPDAGPFAVPSKVLTYLCAGRPILLAAPGENLAARVVLRSEGGFVVDPDRPADWTEAALQLAASPALRRQMGTQARQYAERTFEIARIAAAFERILQGVNPRGLPIETPYEHSARR